MKISEMTLFLDINTEISNISNSLV